MDQFHEIVRVFAAADASVGWCINQNNVFATNSARTTNRAQQEIWRDTRAVVSNGPPSGSTRANICDGGFVLNGGWRFSSGISHANWVAALSPVFKRDEPKPQSVLHFLIPKHQVEVDNAWDVGGLKGTGSFGFTATDLFVPEYRAFNAQAEPTSPNRYTAISTTPLFASGFATVALGTAESALQAAIDTANTKTRQGGEDLLRAESTTQRSVACARAILYAAGSYLRDSVAAMWEASANLEPLALEHRMMSRLASTHAIHEAARATDIAYELCGSSSIFANHPIQRRFQDVHTITQQIQGRMAHYDTVGQWMLGLEPRGVF